LQRKRNSWYDEKILDIESRPLALGNTSLRKAQFAMQGMTCTGCTIGVKSAIETLEGVVSVDVHFILNQAIVVYRPRDINPTQLIDAIKDSGYGATLYEDQELETPQLHRQAQNIRKVEVEFDGHD
jgi:copper chaperone CopZ